MAVRTLEIVGGKFDGERVPVFYVGDGVPDFLTIPTQDGGEDVFKLRNIKDGVAYYT